LIDPLVNEKTWGWYSLKLEGYDVGTSDHIGQKTRLDFESYHLTVSVRVV
jgi:hypothetical protein